MGNRFALIVEGEQRFAALLKYQAVHRGLDPVVLPSAAGLAGVLKERGVPELLVIDVSVPGGDSFQEIGRFRQQASPERSAVVVVSAFIELRTAAARLRRELGIAEVMSPVFSAESVGRCFDRALAHLPAPPITPLPARPAPQAVPVGPKLITTPLPEREASRLARIAAMRLVDDLPPDESLQKLVADVASAFDVPVALVSLVLEDRQWFKAHFGLGGGALAAARGTPRDISFCRHVVEADRPAPLLVGDAQASPLFRDNPLVRDGVLRSYAGVPLVTPEGDVLGTLCILDRRPHVLSETEVQLLQALGRRVAGELDLMSRTRRDTVEKASLRELQASAESEIAALHTVLDSIDAGISLMDAERRILLVNQWLAAMLGRTAQSLVGLQRREFLDLIAPQFADEQVFRAQMNVAPIGPFAAQEELELARPRRRVLRWRSRPLPLRSGVGQLSTYTDVTLEADLAARGLDAMEP